MNRLLEIPPEQLTAEQKTIFDQLVAGRGRILGPYKVWIHSPTIADGMEHIGTYLNKRGSLSPREVEIGILVIARHWDADYVRQAHIREGKRVGLRKRPSMRWWPATILAHRSASVVFTNLPTCWQPALRSRMQDLRRSKRSGRNGIAEVLVSLATTRRWPSR
jgi:4-carboxymuconolactone decarboxylase